MAEGYLSFMAEGSLQALRPRAPRHRYGRGPFEELVADYLAPLRTRTILPALWPRVIFTAQRTRAIGEQSTAESYSALWPKATLKALWTTCLFLALWTRATPRFYGRGSLGDSMDEENLVTQWPRTTLTTEWTRVTRVHTDDYSIMIN